MRQNDPRGLIVGLTGGIACGKSTVADLLAERGAKVFSADEVAHTLLRRGSPIFSELLDTFGPGILQADGEISRSALGQIVFRDLAARKRLEALTHPVIVKRLLGCAWEHVTDVNQGSPRIAVVEAPLLFEAGMEPYVDVTVVVRASRATQIARILARAEQKGQRMTAHDAEQRIQAQMPLEEKVERADYVIDNDQLDLNSLAREVETLWQWLQRVPVRKKGLTNLSGALYNSSDEIPPVCLSLG